MRVKTRITVSFEPGVYHPAGSILDLDAATLADVAHCVDIVEGDHVAPATLAPAPPLKIEMEPGEDISPAAGRVDEIAAAIDLLQEGDFAKGKPKFGPLTAILGFKPTPGEVSAALAKREAEGLS